MHLLGFDLGQPPESDLSVLNKVIVDYNSKSIVTRSIA